MCLVSVVIRRYIDILIIIINFPYCTCIRSFFGRSILTFLFIFKMFFRSCFCYFLQCIFMVPLGLPSARPIAQALRLPFEYYMYSKRYSYNIRDRSKKSRSGEYKYYLIISVIKSVDGAYARANPETSTCEVRNQVRMPFDWRCQQILYKNGVVEVSLLYV